MPEPLMNKTAEQSVFAASLLPKDVWGVVVQYLHIYDIIFARASSLWLYKICKEYRPFPKFFVLDQDKCMEYLVTNGSISCLDYVKNTLRFEWTQRLCSRAAASGQIETLQHFVNNGLDYNASTILLDCTLGTCDINMVRFLHERGVHWGQDFWSAVVFDDLSIVPQQGSSAKLPARQLPMYNMAYHGHLECMKYAVVSGCGTRHLWYTPSIECLDFAIENGFTWKDDPRTEKIGDIFLQKEDNICRVAARLGNLTMLQYAHQKGAPINDSVFMAAISGHLDCLKYAFENSPQGVTERLPFAQIKSKECFEYLANKLGIQQMITRSTWISQLLVGDIETLRFMLKNNFPLPEEKEMAWHWQAATKSLASFKFCLDEAQAPLGNVHIYPRIARHGNLEAFKLALARNLPIRPDSTIMDYAIASKNAALVALAHETFPNQEGFTATQLSQAAELSTPEILDYMARHGVQWTSIHLDSAMARANLPNLAYLMRAGSKWSGQKCANLLCLKYAQDRASSVN